MDANGPSGRGREELMCGIDVVDIDAFADVARTRGRSFLKRVFTSSELIACGHRMDRLAARFAAKEATVKALGTGLAGVRLCDIEVRGESSGKPTLVLKGTAAARAHQLGLSSWAVSLSHSANVATAMVIASARTLPADVPFMQALAMARRAG